MVDLTMMGQYDRMLNMENTNNPNHKHGFSEHPLYASWITMKDRCFNPNNYRYKYYGGRGITVYKEWKHDAKAFIEWALAHGWEKGLCIDRRDNDGNYTPENCRFVGRGLNARNTRLLRKNNKTGYRGVSFNKRDKKYYSAISINGKKKQLGYFDNPMDAAIAYDSMAVVLDDGRPTNFRWPINQASSPPNSFPKGA